MRDLEKPSFQLEEPPIQESPKAPEDLQQEESVFVREQMESITKSAEKARQEEQKNPEKITQLRESIDQSFDNIIEADKVRAKAFPLFIDNTIKHDNFINIDAKSDGRVSADLHLVVGDEEGVVSSGEVFPSGFTMDAKIEGDIIKTPEFMENILNKDRDILQCRDAEFDVNGHRALLQDICPKNVDVYIVPDYANTDGRYMDGKNEKAVIVNRFTSPESFVTLLHEIGHAESFSEKSEEEKETIMSAGKKEWQVKEERDAWANALKTSRAHNLGIERSIKQLAQNALETYQQSVGTNEYCFTNDARKKARKTLGK